MTTTDDRHPPEQPAAAEVRVQLLIAPGPDGAGEQLRRFVDQLADDALPALTEATGASWRRGFTATYRGDVRDTMLASDFLDEALLRMVEGPADLVVVVTGSGLMTEGRNNVAGLASPVANVVVVSTRKLVTAPFGLPVRGLDDPDVRWNGAALLVHLLGHLLGLDHDADGAMAPFRFEEDRREIPPIPTDRAAVAAAVGHLTEEELSSERAWDTVAAHLSLLRRRPGVAIGPAVRARAPLLPFRLGKLTAAAIAPMFIILFTDEFWFLAIHQDPLPIWVAVFAAVIGGSLFLLRSQRLLFPHRDAGLVTAHVALTNVAVIINVVLLMLGVFTVVFGFILLIELWLFPPGYITDWFARDFSASWRDQVNLALVVAAIATTTGAVGGSFHGRTLLSSFGLFLNET